MKNLTFISIFIFSTILSAQTQNANPVLSEKLKNLFKGKTQIENPFSLRDPFRESPKIAKESDTDDSNEKEGEYSNIKELPDFEISDIKVVGVLIGKERRAMIKIGGGTDVYILKEGMGSDDGTSGLKAILPGGLIFFERVVNVYGEEEYLETVVPISK